MAGRAEAPWTPTARRVQGNAGQRQDGCSKQTSVERFLTPVLDTDAGNRRDFTTRALLYLHFTARCYQAAPKVLRACDSELVDRLRGGHALEKPLGVRLHSCKPRISRSRPLLLSRAGGSEGRGSVRLAVRADGGGCIAHHSWRGLSCRTRAAALGEVPLTSQAAIASEALATRMAPSVSLADAPLTADSAGSRRIQSCWIAAGRSCPDAPSSLSDARATCKGLHQHCKGEAAPLDWRGLWLCVHSAGRDDAAQPHPVCPCLEGQAPLAQPRSSGGACQRASPPACSC